MRVLRFVPVFLFFLLLGSQVLFPSGAIGQPCCKCGATSCIGCTCRGLPGCPFCRTGDPDTLQASVPSGNGTMEIEAVPEPLPSTFTTADETLVEVMRGGKRAGGNFILKLLDNAADGQKVSCVSQDNALAFNMAFHALKADRDQ
jgi:hypothetical protein